MNIDSQKKTWSDFKKLAFYILVIIIFALACMAIFLV